MTVTASETALDVSVDVRFTPAGHPLVVRYNGRIWAVMADPVHWFHQDSRRTAAVGSGDLVSVEYWRVQVGLNSTSALRTFDLRRVPLSTQWLLDDISDGD